MRTHFKSAALLVLATIIGLCLVTAASAGEGSKSATLTAQTVIQPSAGALIDVIPFGEIRSWDDGKNIGVLWEDPRDIFSVVVKFASNAPDPASVKLQYWITADWPKSRMPRDKEAIKRISGWTQTGDWFKGKWQDADFDLKTDGATWTYTFKPANAKEFPGVKDFPGVFRTTMKLRLVFPDQAPPVAELHTFTDSTWDRTSAIVLWDQAKNPDRDAAGKVEAFNGYVSSVKPITGAAVWESSKDGSYSAAKGAVDNALIDIWYAKPEAGFSRDESIVTIRVPKHSFSFSPREVAEGARIFVRDYGVLVKPAADETTYAQAEEALQKSAKTRYDLVSELPEQTFTRAWSDMPSKGRIYMPLAVEGGREHFGLRGNGDVYAAAGWARRTKGTDTDKLKWRGDNLTVKLGLPQNGVTGADIEDNDLPIARTWFEDKGVRYLEETFATTLSGKLPRTGRVKADEPQALMLKFRMTNCGATPKIASFPIGISDDSGEMALTLKDNLIYGKSKEGDFLRLLVNTNNVAKLTAKESQVVCDVQLAVGETREFYATLSFMTLETPEEIAQLKALDYNAQHKLIANYWRKRLAQSTQITTPEPLINQFLSAYSSHVLINTDNEVGNDDCAMAKVGTFHYGVYTNESVMMTSDLDRRGYHDVAQKAYETWVRYQGTKPLPGDYSTHEGVFYGANGCQAGGYNQHHGWALWGMGEHYWFTRDNAWLDRIAPNIIKACEWIINQRKITSGDQYTGIRAIERGLLPPGSLEDIGDWRGWMSNNVMSYWGMQNAAKALAARGNPEGERLLKEAAAYREDIRTAYFEAMIRSSVTRLRDGTYVPIIPSDIHCRGRSVGWICEVLEGSIHMIRCGIVDPSEPIAEAIMKDYEDNKYLADQYGYLVPFPDRDWFSLGGFCQQPSLLCSPTPYIMGDNPKHYIRSYFNAFAAGYFPERAMITEHPLPNLGDFAGDHFKSSDEGMNSSWVRWMFIWDEYEDLYLGKTMPRYWLADGQEVKIERAQTHFGQMNMSMKSSAASGSIAMTIDPPTRNAPRAIYARFRHPDGKSMNRVTVNGKPYTNFDVAKEWVVLPALKSKTVVVAYYD